MPTAMLHGVGSVRIWTRGRFDSSNRGNKQKKYTIMEAFTLIRMKEALDRIRKSSGYKVCNKLCALRERHAILYDLTEEQFGIVKHIALRRNVEEGSCRMIDRNRIPE